MIIRPLEGYQLTSIQLDSIICKLWAGGVIAFPTETVYGLGAAIDSVCGIREIFRLKKRPLNHPLILHILDIAELEDYAKDIPPAVYALAEKFMPGPLTLILFSKIESLITGGAKTIAFRIPKNPIARDILRALKRGIAAPSANRFGRLSSTSAMHVYRAFGEEIDIIDGGDSEIGLESTIIDLSSPHPTILRPGFITKEEIEKVLKKRVFTPSSSSLSQLPKAPGNLLSHYAPNTPLILLKKEEIISFSVKDKRVAVFAYFEKPNSFSGEWYLLPDDVNFVGRMLYKKLHEVDILGFDLIIFELSKIEGEWQAIFDRLSKAQNANLDLGTTLKDN